MTKPIARKMAVDCLLYRFGLNGMVLNCAICGEPILPEQTIQFDHVHSDVMGGPHEYQNIRPVHYDPCHKRKTKKDIAAKDKVKRIRGERKPRVKKRIPPGKMLKSSPSWPRGRKIQSRPFQKRKPT